MKLNILYLKKQALKQKMTYAAMGQAAGVATMSVHRLFNQVDPNPQLDVLLKICEAVKANPRSIFIHDVVSTETE